MVLNLNPTDKPKYSELEKLGPLVQNISFILGLWKVKYINIIL